MRATLFKHVVEDVAVDDKMLERPIWSALMTMQSGYAMRNPHAVRFQADIGPLAAMRSDNEAGLAALAELTEPGELLAMIETDIVNHPPGTLLERRSLAVQMVVETMPEPFHHDAIIPLGNADAVEMRALAHLTEPGPFAERTHMLGQFWGIRKEGRLIAMTGERMRMPGFGEVSAVCVHPDARGRGLGGLLTRKAMANLAEQGLRPFLHSYAENEAAISTYRRAGFRVAREMVITMFRKPK
jgi:predicted GNAT family acetyltransferase